MDNAVGPEPLRPSDFLNNFERLCCLVPALIIIGHAPFYISKIFYGHRVVQLTRLFWVKFAAVGTFSAIHISSVLQWWNIAAAGTRLDRASAYASYVGMPCLVLITCLEHLYCLQPGLFLTAFLSTTLLVDILAFPTYFYSEVPVNAHNSHRTLAILKLSLLLLEQLPKYRVPGLDGSISSRDTPRGEHGIWQAPLFRFTKSYLFLGFSSNIGPDFFPDLRDEINAESGYKLFMLEWGKVEKRSCFAPLNACFRMRPSMFLAMVMPRLLETCFTLSKPFLARDVLVAVSASHVPADLTKKLITATGIVFLGNMVSAAWIRDCRGKLVWTIEQILNTAAYHKSLALIGSEVDPATVSRILTGDIDDIGYALILFCGDFAAAMEVAFCLASLASFLGILSPIALFPAILVALTLLVSGTFRLPGTADSATVVGVALIMADLLGTIIRGLQGRLKGIDSLQNLLEFLVREEKQDPRVLAPERLLGSAPAARNRGRGQRRNSRRDTLSEFLIQFIDISGLLLVASICTAYCAQKPWIRNLSIRDNIVGEKRFDRAWLNLIIYVCALDRDLARLPNGELTIAGSDGCNLSGGQKQRVAFARALYAKPDMIIVDDIFAVLDKTTSSTIRIRLFGETEILSANNITLIMSTTQREHTVDADLVFEISSEGLVRERSLASRDASPSYNSGRQTTTRPGLGVVDLPPDTIDDENDVPTSEPVPHLHLYGDGYTIMDAGNGRLNDISLYKFFFLGHAGNLVFVIFCSVVSTAAFAELAPGVFIYFWIATEPDDRTYLLLFTQDVYKTTEGLPSLMMPLVWGCISVVIYFLAFYWASSTAILPLSLAVSHLALSFFNRRASHQLGELQGSPHDTLSKLVADTSAGSEHIHAFGLQTAFLARLHTTVSEIYWSQRQRSRLAMWCDAMSNTIAAAAAIIIAAINLTSSEPSSQIAVGFSFVILLQFGPQINVLALCISAADSALTGARHIRSFIQSTPQENNSQDCDEVPVDWPHQGRIQLNCVTAQYRPIGGVRHTALDHVSFNIEPGQIVGIAGRTGSGKTSILLAILNLLEFEGSISIDNREIRSLPCDILRSRITTMTQSGIELKGSVRLNLDPFDPALRPNEFLLTDDMLIGILRRVGLWSRIEARGGLDAPFNRMKFSNGHKQLFHLARAILHKQSMRTNIVLIDEGAPNAEIEEHMRQVMREVFHNCTILMVSHRMALFHEADLIVTVDRGQTIAYEHDRQRASWAIGRWNRPVTQ
ncbi:hypothetical protein PWT90_03900 [Aphanocladium album]|nr:hypothetical protein PWT90_03900 [Aphanocladium album]